MTGDLSLLLKDYGSAVVAQGAVELGPMAVKAGLQDGNKILLEALVAGVLESFLEKPLEVRRSKE